MPKGASRKDRGLPEKAPAKPKATAAKKRGTDARNFDDETKRLFKLQKAINNGDVVPCCGCLVGNLPTKDECGCYCHETSRMILMGRD